MLTRRQFVSASGLLLPALMVRRSWSQQTLSAASSWQLPPGGYLPAHFPLQIIAPRTGLTKANRYYLAYPGLALSLPVCVIGGAWPFLYQLSGAPSGMTIGQQYGQANYGVITWANPVSGTYNLTVTVIDQQGTQQSVSWTLTVQTANFIFVDSVNGNASAANGGTGTGTISNPFKSMNDWYAGVAGGTGSNTESDSTYAGYFVYYRGNNSNNYDLSACYHNSNNQIPMGPAKPTVHMVYPGDGSPTFAVQAASVQWWFPSSTRNIFVQGVTYDGAPSAMSHDAATIQWDSGVTDVVVTGCTFQQPGTSPVGGGNVPALVYSDDNLPSVTKYMSFVGNTIEGTNSYNAFIGYATQYCLFENNICNGINGVGNGCFYAKLGGNSYWSVRNNIGLAGNTASVDGQSFVMIEDYNTVSFVEIVWNNYMSSGAGVRLVTGDGAVVDNIFLGRNTWQIAAHVLTGPPNPADTITTTDDVNQFTDSAANAHGWILNGSLLPGATFTGEKCVGFNGGFVDSAGDLQGSYVQYLGAYGHQVTAAVAVPDPPSAVSVK
jgi:hypothetical protein